MTGARKPTLGDVARRAGVSVTTASYILNGRSAQMRISSATETRVREVIRELDYRPNWSARTLRRSSTQTIGLISDFVASGAFASRLLSGAVATARAHGQLMVIGETLGDCATEALLIEEMIDRRVDGIVYVTLRASSVTVPASLRSTPTVLLNCADPDADLPAVLPDDEGGGHAAVSHLVENGCGGPIVVVGEDPTPESTAGVDRMRGIERALSEYGAELVDVVSCPWDVTPAREAVDAMLRSAASPGNVICLNDRIAMGAYQALQSHGLVVGADVSVVSFDGSELADWLQPPLTTLALPFQEMGSCAVKLLLEPQGGRPGITRLPLVLRPGMSVA